MGAPLSYRCDPHLYQCAFTPYIFKLSGATSLHIMFTSANASVSYNLANDPTHIEHEAGRVAFAEIKNQSDKLMKEELQKILGEIDTRLLPNEKKIFQQYILLFWLSLAQSLLISFIYIFPFAYPSCQWNDWKTSIIASSVAICMIVIVILVANLNSLGNTHVNIFSLWATVIYSFNTLFSSVVFVTVSQINTQDHDSLVISYVLQLASVFITFTSILMKQYMLLVASEGHALRAEKNMYLSLDRAYNNLYGCVPP